MTGNSMGDILLFQMVGAKDPMFGKFFSFLAENFMESRQVCDEHRCRQVGLRTRFLKNEFKDVKECISAVGKVADTVSVQTVFNVYDINVKKQPLLWLGALDALKIESDLISRAEANKAVKEIKYLFDSNHPINRWLSSDEVKQTIEVWLIKWCHATSPDTTRFIL